MIAVTGSTGHLGRLVIDQLLEKGVAAEEIVALARDLDRAAPLAERGVQVRRADYDIPETLDAALQGVKKLLLISASEVGKRLPQHRNLIEAASSAGVEQLVYTSLLRATDSEMVLAGEHAASEELIRESGIPFVILRNGWYLENYTENLAPTLEHGVLLGSGEEGRVSAATRADYAAAAVAVLTSEGHLGKAYELGGAPAFTLPELAALIASASGKPVEYRDLPEEAYAEALVGVGVPEPFARVLADSDRGIARDDLYTDSDSLARLIGREPTSPSEAIAAALR